MLLIAIYAQSGRHDEAKQLLEKTYPYVREQIEITSTLEGILIMERKFEEAEKLSNRLYELYKIYRK